MHNFTDFATQLFLDTCSNRHFDSARSVQASGAQGMMGQREPVVTVVPASLHSTATEKMRPFAWKIRCLQPSRIHNDNLTVLSVAQIDDTKTSQFHLSETAVVCLGARTCKHHDVLKVGANFVPAAQVEQEGQRVDVCRPAHKHSQLHDARRSRIQHSFEVTQQTRPVGTLPSSHDSHLCLLSSNTCFLYKCDIISGGESINCHANTQR